jgi:RNA polymerase sigma factor (sigma-70 family)
MMPVLVEDDAALLARYVRERNDTSTGREALGELCRRHLDMVYGVARRAVRDPGMADDVSQAVFLILAKKAHTIRHAEHLGSWLFQTTRYTAANAIKMAARRNKHEKKAARKEGAGMNMIAEQSNLVDQLDEALAELPQGEREVILLRFFRGAEYGEIADSLALSEPAARKRLSRGVERLREILGRRGAVTAGAVTAAISIAGAEKASAALATQVVGVVSGGTAPPTVATLVAMGDKKAATAGLIVVALLLLAMVAAILIVNFRRLAPAVNIAPDDQPAAVSRW